MWAQKNRNDNYQCLLAVIGITSLVTLSFARTFYTICAEIPGHIVLSSKRYQCLLMKNMLTGVPNTRGGTYSTLKCF